jgi:hypothetical protein
MTKDYVWQLEVDYPEDAYYEHPYMGRTLDPEWTPKTWSPDEDYEAQFGTDLFVWPAVRRFYLSRSSAVSRANLLEFYGARVRLMRSQALVFEERVFKHAHSTLRLVTGGAA